MDYERFLKKLEGRGYIPYFCTTKEEAKDLVMNQILKGVKTIGKGGSTTLKETGIWQALVEADAREDESRIEMFSTTLYKMKGLDPDEALYKGMTAEAYICSANAITEQGTIINVDGIGNRCGAIVYGPKKVIMVIGKNKIYSDRDTAWVGMKQNTCVPHCGPKQSCYSVGKCVDCDNENRECKVTVILDRALPNREYHLVIVDEKLGV